MKKLREPYRGAHLEYASLAAQKGDLLLGGALDELDGGVLVG